MLKLNVTVADRGQLDKARQLLNPKQFSQAIYQAVKRTTNAGKKIMQQVVMQKTFLQAKYAKRVITSRVVPGDIPTGVVSISQQRVPLVGYLTTATQTLGVVSVVSRDKPPIRLRHAFAAKLQTEEQAAAGFKAHYGIAERTRHLATKGPNAGRGGITPRGFAWRFAVKEAFGPSVLQIIDRDEVTKEAMQQLGDRFDREIGSQIDRFTKGQSSQEGE